MDKNISAYEALVNADSWYRKHKGKYICLVDGRVAGISDKMGDLMRQMPIRYEGQQRYYRKIMREENKSLLRLVSPGNLERRVSCF